MPPIAMRDRALLVGIPTPGLSGDFKSILIFLVGVDCIDGHPSALDAGHDFSGPN
jgi:hypothetical protein